LISGLEDASGGRIIIGNQDVTNIEPADRGIAMVFQSYALYPHMTVRENMSFGLRMSKMPKAEIERRVARAAGILHLEPYLDRKPRQLSGGQRQRVAIGRAIVREPKVFLFDEPLSNLDAELRVQMRLEIAKLHQELGATMIYVTHDQTEAMTLADKIVVLRAGRVEQTGAPLDMYHDPDNVFVAGFIGSPKINFFSGNLVAPDRVRLAQGLEICIQPRARSEGESRIQLAIRPEHFDRAGASSSYSLPVTVELVEHLGGTAYIYGKVASGEPIVIERPDAGALPRGSHIDATFSPDDLLIFDEEGRRIR
jgi:lactose/L-arabinose transport system ATP-binding protein